MRLTLLASAALAASIGAPAAAVEQGIAAAYAGDRGLASDPRVVFFEDFETGTVAQLNPKWDQVQNGEGMSFVSDVPAGSAGSRALRMTTGGTSNQGGTLYTRLPQAQDQLYVRYYVRYGPGEYHHAGAWLGGYNPVSAWPQGGAGEKPAGNERFTVAFEPHPDRMDFYTYYMGMRGPGDGNYWGNSFIQDPNLDVRTNEWMCIEVMIKLNDPLGSSNGELALWIDGEKITHLGPGFPRGSWGPGLWFPDPNGTPFEGFQWRNDRDLKLNFLWLLYYTTSGTGGRMDWDHVVAATEYIGPISDGSGSGGGDPTPEVPPLPPILLE